MTRLRGSAASTAGERTWCPPAGKRSWGGGRGTDFNEDAALEKYGGKLGFARWANDNMIVSAQMAVFADLGRDQVQF